MYVYVHVCSAWEEQKLDPLELELQMVCEPNKWILGTKSWSSVM